MAEAMVDYKPTNFVFKSYNPLSHSEVCMQDGSYLYTNRTDFKNYQKFTVETTIQNGSSKEQQRSVGVLPSTPSVQYHQ